MDESWKHLANWKKLVTKNHILYDSICIYFLLAWKLSSCVPSPSTPAFTHPQCSTPTPPFQCRDTALDAITILDYGHSLLLGPGPWGFPSDPSQAPAARVVSLNTNQNPSATFPPPIRWKQPSWHHKQTPRPITHHSHSRHPRTHHYPAMQGSLDPALSHISGPASALSLLPGMPAPAFLRVA